MDDLEKRIKVAKKKLEKPKRDGIDSSSGMTLVIDLISGVAVGGFLGYTVDQYFETAPLFIIMFIMLGTVAGFYIFYKHITRR